MMRVKDRVAVITGASGGMGRVATEQFAAEGAKLALLGRSQEKLANLAEELGLAEERVLNLSVDLSDESSSQEAAQAIFDKFGRIDILLNLIGGWRGGKDLVDSEIGDLDDMLSQHVRAVFFMLKAFVPYMVKGGWGRVLGITSSSAARPPGRNAAYVAAKAGMEALMFSLAEELKGSGVTANMVAVNTIDVKHERDTNPSPKNQKWATPEEISATLLHLCSEEAGPINGARIPLIGRPL